MDDNIKSIHILLVEGNKFYREIFKQAFEESNITCQITECESAEEALDLLRVEFSEIDVAVIDQIIPGMTGLDLCKIIHKKNPELSLVFLSDTVSEDVVAEALKIGVDEYIIKGSEVHQQMLSQLIQKAAKKHTNYIDATKLESTLHNERSMFVDGPVVVFKWRNEEGWPVEYVSPNVYDVMGYTSEEFLSGEVAYSAIIHVDDTKRVASEVEMNSVESVERFTHKPYRALMKDGSIIWLFDHTTILRDDKGTITHYLGYILNVTELKEAEKALIEAQSRLSIMEDLRKEIAERKKVESQLRKLTVAVEQNPATIAITDPEGNIEYVNPQFRRSTGYTAEEAIGQNPRILKSGTQTGEFYKELWDTITAGKTWKGDFHNKKKNGELYWESASISPIKGENGDIINFIAIKTDVTARRTQEETIRRQYIEEEVLKYILALSLEEMAFDEMIGRCLEKVLSIPFIPLKSKGAIFTVDEGTESLTMVYQSGQGEDLSEKCSKIPFGKCLCGRAAQNGKSEFSDSIDDRHDITYNGMLPHGHYCIPIKMQKEVLGVVTLYLDEGCSRDESDVTFLESIAATIAGIMKRKRIEEALINSEASLVKAQQIAHIGNWAWNIAENDLYWSEEIYRIFGITSEQFKATYEAFIKFVHPEDMERVKELLQKALEGKGKYSIDHRIVLPDGTEKVVHEDGEVEFDDNNRPIRMMGTIHDITERKKNENAIYKAKEEAEEATRLKDKFVSLVSHDLKNPIQRIMSYFDLIESTQQISEQGKEMIEEGLFACEDMTSLINEILNLNRIKGGRIMPEYAFIHAGNIADSVIKNFTLLTNEKGICLRNDIPKNSRIYADGKLLIEVVRNLISNAVKFCEKGDTITLYLPDGEESTIAVADTGIGIEDKRLKTLFKYEEKTSTTGTAGESGTGFGLPLAHDIIKAHGGDLQVESTLGVGSTFYVRLPHVRPRILIADDDKHNITMLEKLLGDLDLDFISAENGGKAVEVLKSTTPHMILLDIIMPDMDGFELLEHVRVTRETEKIPVIVITADTNIDTRDRVFDLGADDYIVKPFKVEDLIPRVRRFVG